MIKNAGIKFIGSDDYTVTLQRVYSKKSSKKKRRKLQKSMPKIVIHCFPESKYQRLLEAEAQVRDSMAKRKAKKNVASYMRILKRLSIIKGMKNGQRKAIMG